VRRREGYGSATRKTARCEQSDTDADTRSDQTHPYWTPQLVDPRLRAPEGPGLFWLASVMRTVPNTGLCPARVAGHRT
jgi:hypothetical protein